MVLTNENDSVNNDDSSIVLNIYYVPGALRILCGLSYLGFPI